MTLTIDLTAEEESALRRKADARGLDVDAYVRRLVQAEAAPGPDAENQAAIRLLRQWDAEDDDMTPEEAAQAEADLEELKVNLNANRAATGERPLFA